MDKNHPIESLMKTTMENLKEMIDVNTIVGDAVETPDGNIIIPISRLTFGFAAGGSDYGTDETSGDNNQKNNGNTAGYPFGGGSGGGITVQPVAFLIVGQGQTRLLPVDSHAMLDRLIDLAPALVNQLKGMMGKDNNGKNNNNDYKYKL